jgi:hypothetical protein
MRNKNRGRRSLREKRQMLRESLALKFIQEIVSDGTMKSEYQEAMMDFLSYGTNDSMVFIEDMDKRSGLGVTLNGTVEVKILRNQLIFAVDSQNLIKVTPNEIVEAGFSLGNESQPFFTTENNIRIKFENFS